MPFPSLYKLGPPSSFVSRDQKQRKTLTAIVLLILRLTIIARHSKRTPLRDGELVCGVDTVVVIFPRSDITVPTSNFFISKAIIIENSNNFSRFSIRISTKTLHLNVSTNELVAPNIWIWTDSQPPLPQRWFENPIPILLCI